MGDKVKGKKKKQQEECRVYFQKQTLWGFFHCKMSYKILKNLLVC